MTGALALVAALTISSQLQTHPTGLPSVGPSRANSLRTAPIIDKLYEQAGKPALDFDFARYKDLHDNASGATSLVNFSRSAAQSPGTYVGSDGLIHTAAVNLALYSEQFDQWTNSSTTDSANQTAAPDGKQTADTVTATGANGTISRGVTTTAIDYTFSIYIKRKTGTGDIDISADGSTWVTQTITGDWQRFSVTQTGVAGTSNPGVRIVTSGDEVYIWGAQLEETDPATMAPTAYIKTTSQALAAPRFDHDPVTGESLGLLVEEARANEVFPSEDLSSATLANSGTGLLPVRTNDYGVAPDGQTTAERFVFDRGAGTTPSDYSLALVGSPSISTGEYLTSSVYVKSLSGTKEVIFYVTGLGTSPAIAVENVSDSEWKRIYITSGTATSSGQMPLWLGTRGGSYGGDQNLDVIVWGVQAEKNASFPTSYIPTTSSAQTRYADVAAVQDEDFSTTNLLSYSESFDVSWAYSGTTATITANASAAPDGQLTADLMTAGATGATNYIGKTVAIPAGARTASVYVKRGTANWVALNFGSGSDTAWFDVQNLTTGTINGGGSHSINDIGDGWLRLQLTQPTSGNAFFVYLTSADSTFSGNAGDNIYLWGASLTATEYPVEYVTTRNLLTDSQDFERGTWVKQDVTIDNDAAQAPDGTLTADRIFESNTTGGHLVYELVPVISGNLYTFSAYIKRAERDYAHMAVFVGFPPTSINIDLTDGSVTTGDGAPVNAFSIDSGDGWYRVGFSVQATSTTNAQAVLYVSSDGVWANRSYAGDNTSGVLVWGAQLEPGTTATDYTRTVDVVGKAYNWYEPTEGTVFVDVVPAYDGAQAASVVTFNTTSYQESNIIYKTNYNALGAGLRWVAQTFDGTTQALLPTPTDIADVEASLAFGYKYNNFGFGAEGALIGPDPTGTTPNPSQMYIMNRDGSLYLNGHIRRLTYWPRRQSDSTLQVITQ